MGSNTFGSMEISSSQKLFELIGINHSARSGGIIGIYFQSS